ncbi:hypothetical protein HanXRQr2_Chr10g0429791 [Helianthus annuus]|uniref:Uncharacterized protein n=1 Tax=Helianthus annuus TaxID=4232 RepID=A0A9K3HWE8_HELAN|nr:hypothetical protein HanXRQr2_Chr10g0429791 [Helianthus annuus]KAJ0529203.1 hypothetical protein HanHA89_Chr10g0375091 [Helianthus annuus]
MHVGSHVADDWDALEAIGETPRLRYFIPLDSSSHRLFELAHTPSYKELLIKFLSTFTFHPPRADQPPAQPHASPPPLRLRFHLGLLVFGEEIATDIYMQGLIVVDRPTLLRFCKMVAGAGTWEHDKAKESMLMAHCRGTMISTSITARGHNREWCTSIDVFFFYCLLYRRSCALAHGLAQYFTSAHHWQERRILHGGTYVTVIAHSLGHLTEVDPQLLPPIAPTRMSFQTLRGMKLNKRFDVLGERFKTRGVLIWVPRDLPEQFDLVYHPPDVAAIVQDPLMDLDGPAMPSHHHLPGRPSFHDTLFQVMPRELQQIRIYEPTLTGLWIWWVG